MDIISHGLWGSAFMGTEKKSYFWPSFALGMLPDLLAFSVPFIIMIVGAITGSTPLSEGRPAYLSHSQSYISDLYSIGHSFVIFAAFFLLVWFILKKPYLPMIAWALHILLDIFTHSAGFFGTPFLWPISNYKYDGTPWANPMIFFPNVAALAIAYIAIYLYKKHKRKMA